MEHPDRVLSNRIGPDENYSNQIATGWRGAISVIDWLRLTSIMNTHGRSRPNEN